MVAERSGVTSVRWATFGVATLLLVALVGLLHAACLHFYPKEQLDPWGLSDFYPLSVFKWRVPGVDAIVPIVTLGMMFYNTRQVIASGTKQKTWVVVLLGVLWLLISNLLHGLRYGIDYPTASVGTGGIEYYHDAILIKGALWFLARFNDIQFELLEHARTHPPGPVLLYYVLHHTLKYPQLISIAVGALSLGLALPYLRRGVMLLLDRDPSPGGLLLYTFMPAVMIYGIAVVDAVIASLFLATLVSFLDEERRASAWLAALWLALSLCFTFAAVFLLPVLGGFELLRRKRVARSLMVFGAAALLLWLLWFATGYDWFESFRSASAIENEKGFLLFANPRGYLWYRLGAVAEIAIFFTPFVAVLAYQGLGKLRREHADAFTLSWLGPAVLALMLLAGMLKIGEAARVCIFIVPYLMLPAYRTWSDLDQAGRLRTLGLVLGWSTLMQLFGFYQW